MSVSCLGGTLRLLLAGTVTAVVDTVTVVAGTVTWVADTGTVVAGTVTLLRATSLPVAQSRAVRTLVGVPEGVTTGGPGRRGREEEKGRGGLFL